QKVEFYAGDTLLSTDTTAPFEATWDVANATPGNHVLRAVAFDDKGAMLAEKKVNVIYQPASASSYSTPLIIGAIVLVVLGLAVGGFFITRRRKAESPSPMIDLTLDKTPASAGERSLATLTVEAFGGSSGDLLGKEFQIQQRSITLGRENCDIVIPDKAISRSHAQITLGGGGSTVEQSSGLPGETADEIILGSTDKFYITDIESKFHTFVDDKQIPSGQAMPLRNGALIKLGKRTILRFHDLRPSSGVSSGGLSGETVDEFKLDDGETQDQLGSR
ncbi:MAG: FHA domain-containing protein, partial [Patescibacteria group bacterium]